jgi:hypothetical protein
MGAASKPSQCSDHLSRADQSCSTIHLEPNVFRLGAAPGASWFFVRGDGHRYLGLEAFRQ